MLLQLPLLKQSILTEGARRVLITGAGGQLGQALAASVPCDCEAVFLSRRDWDFSREGPAEAILDRQQPGVVINAAAWTAVDSAEEAEDLVFRINGGAVAELAAASARRGIRLIQISTDFVFDGHASSPYQVDDATGPLNVYGASKLAGEEAVLASGAESCILRTAWVYHGSGKNFVNRMLELMQQGRDLRVVSDQIGTPTSAATLAETVWALVRKKKLPRILHWTDAGTASWYDLACCVQKTALELGLLKKAAALLPIRTHEYPTPAKRPAYTVLDKSLTWELLGLTPVHWQLPLLAMLQQKC